MATTTKDGWVFETRIVRNPPGHSPGCWGWSITATHPDRPVLGWFDGGYASQEHAREEARAVRKRIMADIWNH